MIILSFQPNPSAAQTVIFTQIHYLQLCDHLSLVHNMMLELQALQVMSVTEKSFFTSQILFLMSNFSTVWLVECWLTLATQHWNRNRVYSSVIPTLVMLHCCQRHILNQLYIHVNKVVFLFFLLVFLYIISVETIISLGFGNSVLLENH